MCIMAPAPVIPVSVEPATCRPPSRRAPLVQHSRGEGGVVALQLHGAVRCALYASPAELNAGQASFIWRSVADRDLLISIQCRQPSGCAFHYASPVENFAE